MKVESTNSVIGWYYDNQLRTERRQVHNYESGNSVTTIERRMINVQLYNEQGAVIPVTFKGTHLDLMV
jgi:hypothetical protein